MNYIIKCYLLLTIVIITEIKHYFSFFLENVKPTTNFGLILVTLT